ncbi:hypothetical protein Tcan_10407 [Toxocara canis]|uniref:Uncharacterized protein n=1 Tax=Toxocara canis TaxID=6265 RepID=A0A0B2VMG4_TOXCA|nr:hypothetical protein Tcan_10407 [Toxocara canis]
MRRLTFLIVMCLGMHAKQLQDAKVQGPKSEEDSSISCGPTNTNTSILIATDFCHDCARKAEVDNHAMPSTPSQDFEAKYRPRGGKLNKKSQDARRMSPQKYSVIGRVKETIATETRHAFIAALKWANKHEIEVLLFSGVLLLTTITILLNCSIYLGKVTVHRIRDIDDSLKKLHNEIKVVTNFKRKMLAATEKAKGARLSTTTDSTLKSENHFKSDSTN